jgi:hypothetical protein
MVSTKAFLMLTRHSIRPVKLSISGDNSKPCLTLIAMLACVWMLTHAAFPTTLSAGLGITRTLVGAEML